MRRLICLSILFSFAVAGVDGAGAEMSKAEKLIVEVQSNGAAAVLDKLTYNGMGEFERVCKQIESGKQAWLVLAKMLKEGAGAEITMSLNHAMARALLRAPVTVMEFLAKEERLSSKSFSLDEICIAPFVVEEPLAQQTYLRQAERSLIAMPIRGRVDIRELQKNCLKRLRASMQTNENEMANASDQD